MRRLRVDCWLECVEGMGVVHRVIRLLCVLYDGGFWKGGIDLVGVYVEMNRRIALVGPNKSEQEA
jgi:hypothetical protein